MDQRVTMITLGVADLAATRRFYEDGLGWRPAQALEGVAFYQAGGMVLGLFPRAELAKDARLGDTPIDDTGAGFGGIALALNMRSKAEVDAVLAEAEAAGATILKPAEDAFWGGYSGYFADPDGHPWEVAWNPFWTLAPDGAVTIPAEG